MSLRALRSVSQKRSVDESTGSAGVWSPCIVAHNSRSAHTFAQVACGHVPDAVFWLMTTTHLRLLIILRNDFHPLPPNRGLLCAYLPQEVVRVAPFLLDRRSNFAHWSRGQ